MDQVRRGARRASLSLGKQLISVSEDTNTVLHIKLVCRSMKLFPHYLKRELAFTKLSLSEIGKYCLHCDMLKVISMAALLLPCFSWRTKLPSTWLTTSSHLGKRTKDTSSLLTDFFCLFFNIQSLETITSFKSQQNNARPPPPPPLFPSRQGMDTERIRLQNSHGKERDRPILARHSTHTA